jgi:hypothetical protein
MLQVLKEFLNCFLTNRGPKNSQTQINIAHVLTSRACIRSVLYYTYLAILTMACDNDLTILRQVLLHPELGGKGLPVCAFF